MNPAELKARGQHAANLLKDETLQEALREVRYAAHRAFEAAGGDAAKLARASDLLEAANTFQRHLTAAMTRGKAAAKEIDRDLNSGKFIRGIGRLTRSRNELADDMPWSSVA